MSPVDPFNIQKPLQSKRKGQFISRLLGGGTKSARRSRSRSTAACASFTSALASPTASLETSISSF
jgi:hypothetical protein